MNSAQLDCFLAEFELGYSFFERILGDFKSHYSLRMINKKAGGIRIIHVPSAELRWIHSRILSHFRRAKFVFPPHVQGGIVGRSPRTNASFHTGKDAVLSLDLENFFDFITFEQVQNSLEEFGCKTDLAVLFAKLVTFEGRIPQGASTSVFIANLVGLKLDEKILPITERFALDYSRYIDDISISGSFLKEDIFSQISKEIEDLGFRINFEKVKMQRKHRRQTVNNVVVNTRTNVRRKYIKHVKNDLHYCEQYGIFGHCEQLGLEQDSFVKSLAARIGYINSIDSVRGSVLIARFHALKNNSDTDIHFIEFQRKSSLN